MRYGWLISSAFVLALPAMGLAFGAHDGLDCTGCHGIHTAKGEIIFAVEPNKKSINNRTKQPNVGTTALCLGCHESSDKGGMGILPVSAAMSHPFGIAPNSKIATVPAHLLRDGKLECVGCHDPHPSNSNYKYLRVDTAKGTKMSSFCGMCHTSKPGSKADVVIFDSMDERRASSPKQAEPAQPKPETRPIDKTDSKPKAAPRSQHR